MATLTQRAKSALVRKSTSCATAKTEQKIAHLVGTALLAGVVIMLLASIKDIARYVRIKTM